MINIWEVIAHMGIELHPDRIEYMARKTIKLNKPQDLLSAPFIQGLNINLELLIQLKNAWEDAPNITSKEVAAALRSASVTSYYSIKRQGFSELVWTGPATNLVPIRHTEQVLKEVIDLARHRIFIISFVAYELPSIVSSLKSALGRGVKVDVLLEISNEHGGRVSNDSTTIMKEMIPDLDIFVWDQYEDKTSTKFKGAVHPKCAVSDGEIAFITSANLTRAAMEQNMELGVLIKGGSVPEKLDLHLEALKTTGIIKKV